jgi:hypothetical protein
MDSMHQKMKHEETGSVRKDLVNVEQESVEEVFQHCPDKVSKEEAGKNFRPGFQRDVGKVREW